MLYDTSQNGWNRIASGLDVEIQHGVPVRVSQFDRSTRYIEQSITEKIMELTGLSVSVHDRIRTKANELEFSVCVDKTEFAEVLKRLALSSASMYVDRFHKAIDHTAVDWDSAEYSYDFNHAMEHCCIPYGTLNKDYYFTDYIKTMHEESLRLIEEGVSPLVEAE